MLCRSKSVGEGEMVNNGRMCARWTVRGLVLGSLALVVLLGFLSGCHLFTRTVRQLAQPTNVSATDGVYPDMVRVTWAAVDGATGYEIQRATGENAPYSKIGETTDTTFNDTDVTLGIVYWYRIRARAAGEFGPRSEPISGYPEEADLQAPAAPTSISATRGDHTNKIVVNWDAMELATSYEVYRKDDQEDSYKQVGTSSGTSYDDTNVTPGRTYWYRTRACGEGGCSGLSPSDAWGFAEEAPPDDEPPIAPRVVTASEGEYSDRIHIEWSSVTGATGYEVWRAQADDSPSVSPPPAGHTYERIGSSSAAEHYDVHHAGDNPLDACGDYWYRIRACNDEGCSTLSRADSGYRGTRVVSPPSGVSASQGSYTDRIRLSWLSVSGASEYEILRSANGGDDEPIDTITGTSYDDIHDDPANELDAYNPDTSAGTRYSYVIVAHGEVPGCWSERSTSVTGWVSCRPGKPVNVDVVGIIGGNRITWAAGTSIKAPTDHEVHRSSTSSTDGFIKISELAHYEYQYDDLGATSGVRYWYKVKADNVCGASTSDVVSIVTATKVPDAPTNVDATDGEHSDKIRVTWDASSGATRYEAWRADGNAAEPDPDDFVELGDSTTTRYDDFSDLTGCKEYWYRVRACNALGCSDLDESDSGSGYRGRDMTEAPHPTNLTASNHAHDNRIEVSWGSVSGATGYELDYSDDDGADWSTLYEGTKTTYTHKYDHATDVPEPGAEYLYRVRAYGDDQCGETDWSTAVPGIRSGLPDNPNLTSLVNTVAEEITLKWEWTWNPENSPNPVDKFRIYRRRTDQTGHDLIHTKDVDLGVLDYEPDEPEKHAFEWIDGTVEEDIRYEYFVRAWSSAVADGRDSNKRSATAQ